MQGPREGSPRQTPMRAQRRQASPASASSHPRFSPTRAPPRGIDDSYACQGLGEAFRRLIFGFEGRKGLRAGLRTRQGRATPGRASSYQVTPSKSGWGPGAVGESFAGQLSAAADYWARSPPGLSRWRVTFPEEAGIGAVAHRCAQAASERSRSGWSPAAIRSLAAVSWPTP